jgi:hypothetical protein
MHDSPPIPDVPILDPSFPANVFESVPAISEALPEPTHHESHPSEEPSAMLDVHPAHHAANTWRDFFIHIATICIGLLIAIGLEQSVEAIHRGHQRKELRESLQQETEQILQDSLQTDEAMTAQIQWFKDAENLLDSAAKGKHTLGALPPVPQKTYDIPDNPVYKSAKSSNKLELLSQQEVQAYGEVDALIEQVRSTYSARTVARREEMEILHELSFTHQIPASAPKSSFHTPDQGFDALAGLTLSDEDLLKIYQSTIKYQIATGEFRGWVRHTRGAAVAMQQGERDLHKIEAAERQFNNLP